MSRPQSAFDAKAFLGQLTTQPGVYRMIGADGEALYVGKARNLKKRVGSYFLRASGDRRIEAMVDQIQRIEVTVTRTEDDALLLEANLIKELRPRYNIMLRDDKSYPFLKVSVGHAYPRIGFYRGARQPPDRYYGPFANAGAVRETILSLQKLFRLRPCTDTFFANRGRPCLQYQIKRCSGPCVGYISTEEYGRDLRNAERLLQGRGEELDRELSAEMEKAAAALEYERAARMRDQIAALRRVQESRTIVVGERDVDVIAVAPHAAHSAIVVMTVRDGFNRGDQSFFPQHPVGVEAGELLAAFLAQYYLERPAPKEVLVATEPDDRDWIAASLSSRAGRRVAVEVPRRGIRARLLEMAQATAVQALQARLVAGASMAARLRELQEVLGLDRQPQRVECFDISHTRGAETVASCVVFNEEGPMKTSYRRFNIEGVTPGDDYAAIAQAVARRYRRVKQGEISLPDIVFIDGGKGQLGAAVAAIRDVGLEQEPCMVAIAKGPTRRPGLEQLFVAGQEAPLILPPDSPALHLIQRIRDEAHRFAITGHRGRREKARLGSELEQIEGLGPKRRKALLTTLGGLQQVRRAGVEELARVEGINRRLAERIYAFFH